MDWKKPHRPRAKSEGSQHTLKFRFFQAPRFFGLGSGLRCGLGFTFRKPLGGPSICSLGSPLSTLGKIPRGSIHHDTPLGLSTDCPNNLSRCLAPSESHLQYMFIIGFSARRDLGLGSRAGQPQSLDSSVRSGDQGKCMIY